MDRSIYRSFKTSRGFTYGYYFAKAQEGKPYIVFLHGYPQTSRDWRHQVPFFESKGFGLVVPDLLGYGATDKPSDVEAYRQSRMSVDVLELLDNEGAERAIVVGHDWGAIFAARIAARYQDRFLGFGFLSLGYMPPTPDFNYDAVLKANREAFGNEIFGYWEFLNQDDAPKIANEHFESFYSILFCKDPSLVLEHAARVGDLKKWLLEDRRTEIAPYLTEEDKEERRKEYASSNLAGMNWYKPSIRGIAGPDDADIPVANYAITKPVFFGATLRDAICKPALGMMTTKPFCPNLTYAEFDTDHWVTLAAPDALNEELLKWINTVTAN